MKKFTALFLSILMCLLLCSCGQNTSDPDTTTTTQKQQTTANIKYSNLTDSDSQEKLVKALEKNGVKSENIDSVLQSIIDYNATIQNTSLVNSGSIDLASPIPQYDDIKIDELWLNKYEMFIGFNCRITAFSLMKDFITVADTTKSNTSALFMDEDALTNAPKNPFSDSDMQKFESVYSVINTISSTNPQEQFEVQNNYWNKIGVTFNTNEGISLISVYIHNHFSEEENELIIGHTGVLIQSDNEYLFLEKLSFQLPYQLITFNSKEDLKNYLMACYDTDTSGENAKPFILENDKLM